MSGNLNTPRANYGVSVAALAAASANSQTPDQDNQYGDGIHLDINITAISGTGASLTVTLVGYDPVSGTYYTILASAALTATGFTRLTVFPGATAAANSVANDFLPRTWGVKCAIVGTTPSVTATIGASVRVGKGS